MNYKQFIRSNSLAALFIEPEAGWEAVADGDIKQLELIPDSSIASEFSIIFVNDASYGNYIWTGGYIYNTAGGNKGHIYNKELDSLAEGTNEDFGDLNTASGIRSHAEGKGTESSGNYSHAEGYNTTASGEASHAAGILNNANGDGSHAEGIHNETNNIAEHAEGQYNQSHEGKTIHSIGIGYKENDIEYRKNAFEVMQDGSIYVYGLGNYDGSTLSDASTLQEVVKNSDISDETAIVIAAALNNLNDRLIALDTTISATLVNHENRLQNLETTYEIPKP